MEISALRRGFNVLNINEMTEEEINKEARKYAQPYFDESFKHTTPSVSAICEHEVQYLINAFKEGARLALSNQWNDASKELPFPHEEVYVLDSEGFPDIGFHEQNGAWKTRGSLRFEKIQYWMPIPPAPRKENIK